MKQSTFADLEYDAKNKRTRREKFLHEMDQVVPWSRWMALIEPHYPKAGVGRRPMPLERMLRIYLLQQWFNLSDPAMEEMLIDSQSMRRFAGINLMDDPVPDRRPQKPPAWVARFQSIPSSTVPNNGAMKKLNRAWT